MATYDQAKAAIDPAMALVSRYGGTVLHAAPRRSGNEWIVEIETARPLPSKIGSTLKYRDVTIVVQDAGLTPRAVRRRRVKDAFEP